MDILIQNHNYQKMIIGLDYSSFCNKNLRKLQKNHNQFIQEAKMDQIIINFGKPVMRRSGYIFGGYSPCKWQQNINTYVQDDTLSSFIFSQTHDQIYRLKQDSKQKAIYCYSNYGPVFGGGHDLKIESDFTKGYSGLGNTYQWDQYQNQNSSHLFGQNTPNVVECEIYQLIFI